MYDAGKSWARVGKTQSKTLHVARIQNRAMDALLISGRIDSGNSMF
jgi:hypothetical protein